MKRGIYTSESDYFPIRDSGATDGLPTNLTLLNFTANLSTINGRAFISNPSTVLTPYLDMKITITAGGKTLVGWIKSAGTGETYDVERFTDPAFDTTADWTKGTGWAVSGGKATATTSTGDITEALANTVGNLYKLVVTSATLTAGTYQGIIEATNIGTAVNTVGATGWYRTVAGAGSATNGIHGATSLSATYTDISLTKVLTCSSTGVRIVSAKSNTTYNWASNDGIDPNSTTFTAVLSLT